MGITQDGKVVISNNLISTPTDVLTVKDNLGFWSLTDGQKNINGHAVNGFLGMYANTFSTDGSGVEVFGKNHPSFNGSVHYDSYHDGTHPITDYGHIFQNYDATLSTPSWIAGMGITKNGRVVISDVLVSAPTEMLTVKDNIGISSSTDHQRSILARANAGYLGMYTNSASNNGSNIEMYGPANTFHGQIHYTSYLQSTGLGHEFSNWNGTTWKPLFRINNNTEIQTGNKIFMNIDADVQHCISSCSNAGYLALYANSTSNNGANIEMYGTSNYPFKGQIHYTSYLEPIDIGHQFSNWNGTTWMPLFHIYNNAVLQTGNTINMDIAGDIASRTITANSTNHHIELQSGAGGATISLNGSNVGGSSPNPQNGSIYVTTTGFAGTGSSPSGGINFVYNNGVTNKWNMLINNSGKVVIGEELITGGLANPTPAGYNLYVSKGILTEKLKVANSGDPGNWSDFVFNNDYELMPLSDVESYVKKNKHLPEIPSAIEVAKDGIDVAAMDAKLLQKIEELTLYVIQQQKEINELKRQVKR